MPYQNVKLSVLRTYILARIQNTAFYSNAELLDAANEAIRLFQVGSGFWRARFSVTTVAKRCIYDTTAIQTGGVPQILMPIRCAFGSTPMDPCSTDDMDGSMPGWQFHTTTTTGVPSTPSFWGPIGCNKFFIWPADEVGNNSLGLDAITRAPTLTLDDDYINIDSTELRALVGYCQHILTFKRGGMPFQATMPLFQEFLKAIALRNNHLRAVAPFSQYATGDSSRRTRPRKAKDQTGQQYSLGVK